MIALASDWLSTANNVSGIIGAAVVVGGLIGAAVNRHYTSTQVIKDVPRIRKEMKDLQTKHSEIDRKLGELNAMMEGHSTAFKGHLEDDKNFHREMEVRMGAIQEDLTKVREGTARIEGAMGQLDHVINLLSQRAH